MDNKLILENTCGHCPCRVSTLLRLCVFLLAGTEKTLVGTLASILAQLLAVLVIILIGEPVQEGATKS